MESEFNLRVAALAGGVGGARMAQGLARVLPPGQLSVIVNVADDFDLLGLTICPDLDTVTYTLAGINDEERGWGIAGDTFHCLDALRRLGAPDWFAIGDRDFATHLIRSRWIWEGISLTEITLRIATKMSIAHQILPITDDIFKTIIQTDTGELAFQEYFVQKRFEPEVKGIRFVGAETASPTDEALEAIERADLVVVCPSNPFVSIAPIVFFNPVTKALIRKPVVAVSPIVGTKAVKGPAAKMFREMGREPSALEVAKEYSGWCKTILIDHADAGRQAEIEGLGLRVMVTDIMMPGTQSRVRLAEEILRAFQSGTFG